MLDWQTINRDGFCVVEFELIGDLVEVGQLSQIQLPSDVRGQESGGIVFSGRGPVWLYAYLTHLAHSFAWVATHDPRLGGAVVVQRHHPDAPSIGTVIPLTVVEQ